MRVVENKLFESVQLGELRLANRIVMAPMTRSRADANGVPGELHAAYYGQRSDAGLIVAEGTYPSEAGKGYCRTPGIVTPGSAAGRFQQSIATDSRRPGRQPPQQS
jgi:N-ethylmaleimide reductase